MLVYLRAPLTTDSHFGVERHDGRSCFGARLRKVEIRNEDEEKAFSRT